MKLKYFLLPALLLLLFFIGCSKEEKPVLQPPTFKMACLKEMTKPFMVEINAKSIDCYHDKKQTIFYFNYDQAVEKDWQKIAKNKLRIKLTPVSKTIQKGCVEKDCAYIVYNKNGVFKKGYLEKIFK